MTTELSLWGTFSVVDHRRRRPFVGDVLLYDRLVIPVPADDDEQARWRGIGRDPDRQADLLEIIGKLAVRVPWTLERHDAWKRRSAEAAKPGDADDGELRDEITRAVAFDANNVNMARRAWRETPAEASFDPDDPGFMMTRMILADEYGSARDHAIVANIPRVDEVEAVVAYGSYRSFSKERGTLTESPNPRSQPVFTFGWQFFVPSSSTRTDDDLLREAVELAHEDEVVAWRAAVQRWRRDTILSGESDDDALREMAELIRDYRKAALRRKIEVRSRWGLGVAAAAAGVAAVLVPPIGLAAAVCGLGTLVTPRAIPKRLEAAAMFYEARRRFM